MGKETDKKVRSARVTLAAIAVFLAAMYAACGLRWQFERRRISAQVEANPSRKERLRTFVPDADGTLFLHRGISRPDVAIVMFDLYDAKRRHGCVVLIDGERVFARRTSPSAFPLAGVPNGRCALSSGGKKYTAVVNGHWRGSPIPRFKPDEKTLRLAGAALAALQKSAEAEALAEHGSDEMTAQGTQAR